MVLPQEARSELEAVRDKAPREAQVYIHLGRVCKITVRCGLACYPRPSAVACVLSYVVGSACLQRDYDAAIRFYNIALDLDPKDPHQVKVLTRHVLWLCSRQCPAPDAALQSSLSALVLCWFSLQSALDKLQLDDMGDSTEL